MKKKHTFMLTIMTVVCVTLLVGFGIFYLTSNGYQFQYSSWYYSKGTVVQNYSAIQTENQLKIKFGSLKGNKNYSIMKRDYQTLTIEGEMTKGEFDLFIYDDQNNEIQSLTQNDLPYQLDLLELDSKQIKFNLEGNCSGNLTISLE